MHGLGYIADTSKPEFMIGNYMQILADNSRKIVGYHHEGKRHGRWQFYYYLNGVLRDSGQYRLGQKQGRWVYCFQNGLVSVDASYKSDTLHGYLKAFWPNGKIRADFTINGGQIASGRAFDSTGMEVQITSHELQTEPEPINMDSLKRKIGYPVAAKERGIKGSVVIRILIGSNGEYISHQVIKSPSKILSHAVEKHIPKLKFKPAVLFGVKIWSYATIPFNFQLLEQPDIIIMTREVEPQFSFPNTGYRWKN